MRNNNSLLGSMREASDNNRHIVARAALMKGFVDDCIAGMLKITVRLAQLVPAGTNKQRGSIMAASARVCVCGGGV